MTKKFEYVTANKIIITGKYINAVSGFVNDADGLNGFMYILTDYDNGATLKLLYEENTINFGFTDNQSARIALGILSEHATKYADFKRIKNVYFEKGV